MENTEQRKFTVEDVTLDGNRVRVTIAVPGGDPATVYAQHAGAYWTVLGLGTGFEPAFRAEHSIPISLWVG